MNALGLAPVCIRTRDFTETVWAQLLSDPDRARVLSVVRYGAPCQFGDIVKVQRIEELEKVLFLEVIESAGYALHEVRGGVTEAAQSMALTERMREAGLHIEVWSLTMAGGSADPRPLRAGLALPTHPTWPNELTGSQREIAEVAQCVLVGFSRDFGVEICAETVFAQAGDELGARRSRKRAPLLPI